MNSNFDICMKNWVKMINESTYSFNPDEDKQDKLDMQADDYQELQKDIDDYYKKAEDGKIEGNLTTEDDKSDETSTEEEKTETEPAVDDEKKSDEEKPTGEAMSPDEIIKQFDKKNEKLAAEQAQVAKNVKRVDILELYDDYVNADSESLKISRTEMGNFVLYCAEGKIPYIRILKWVKDGNASKVMSSETEKELVQSISIKSVHF